MPLPVPRPGLVICYSYLWADQAREGGREGRKDRPCVIVVAVEDRDGETLVYVAPVTHSPPDGGDAVPLPGAVKRHLGLDAAISWIVTSEVNRFVWPGYDLRPIQRNKPGVYAWGVLPVELFEAVRNGIVQLGKAGALKTVRRE